MWLYHRIGGDAQYNQKLLISQGLEKLSPRKAGEMG